MGSYLITPVNSLWLFYLLVLAALVFVVVSLARVYVRYSGNVTRLAARGRAGRGFVYLVALAVWVICSTYVFYIGYFLVLGTMLAGTGEGLGYIATLLAGYGLITLFLVLWAANNLLCQYLMVVFILSVISVIMQARPAWVYKPLADSGVWLAYGPLARAYESPGGKGVGVSAEEMRFWYERAAEAGDPDAAYLVAIRSGDKDKQRRLLETAAKKGHARAAYRYSLQLSGEDALHWLEFAAQRGEGDALLALGELYEHGVVVNQDLKRAGTLYIEAAEAGSPRAMLQLVTGYATGNAVFDRDTDKSRAWQARLQQRNAELEQLAKTFMHPTMQEAPHSRVLGAIIQNLPEYWEELRSSELFDPSLSTSQQRQRAEHYITSGKEKTELRAKGFAILKGLAADGDAESAMILARVLMKETHEPLLQEEGRQWLIKAAELGHIYASGRLAYNYRKGVFGFERDLDQAMYYNQRQLRLLMREPDTYANRQQKEYAFKEQQEIQQELVRHTHQQNIEELKGDTGNEDAQRLYELADQLMRNGQRDEAIAALKKAAEAGHPDAQFMMITQLDAGRPGEAERAKSTEYLQAAARQNHPGALVSLGNMYFNGNPRKQVEKNLYLARLYYLKVLRMTQDDVVYYRRFGMDKDSPWFTRKHVTDKLAAIPAAIQRLDLSDTMAAEQADVINNWYYHEIEQMPSNPNNSELLELLNQQRNVLLRSVPISLAGLTD